MRVVAGVHDGAADGRAPAHVAAAAGLAVVDVLEIDVADLADRGHADLGDVAKLAGGQADERHAVFLRHQLGHDAGRTRQLRALARVKLDVVDEGTGRDVHHRQRVARLDVRLGAGDHRVADLEAVGRDDVALLAVLVLDERDVGGAVGVILERQDLGRDIGLVALEIDDAVFPAVAAAAVADGDPAVAVASGVLLDRLKQALFRSDLAQLAVVGDSHLPATGRSGLIALNSHSVSLSSF